MYGLHPSKELVTLFRKAPFQGTHPRDSKIIFFGIDANYSELFVGHPFFRKIIEYQRDAGVFWRTHGRHHPFLLEEYPFKKNTGGVPYHRNFAKLKLSAKYAWYISFTELLDVPTTGNSTDKGFWELFNPDHAAWIDSILSEGTRKIVFLPNDVIKKMRKIKKKWDHFTWLPNEDVAQGKLCSIRDTEIYKISHFSAWQIHSQISEIRKLIDVFCANTTNQI